MSSITSVEEELAAAYRELEAAQEKYRAARAKVPPEVVRDYTLTGPGGVPVTLSSLFGERTELMVIHNMGKGCEYCTLWADGFNGVYQHLRDRAPFVVISPDAPEVQAAFAASRGWQFPMMSSMGTTFRADMGFENEEGTMPGVSTFRKNADGTITHTAKDMLGPGDDYCAVWHLFDLLPDGVNGWEPKFTYQFSL